MPNGIPPLKKTDSNRSATMDYPDATRSGRAWIRRALAAEMLVAELQDRLVIQQAIIERYAREKVME